jgi:hypothetical protein
MLDVSVRTNNESSIFYFDKKGTLSKVIEEAIRNNTRKVEDVFVQKMSIKTSMRKI